MKPPVQILLQEPDEAPVPERGRAPWGWIVLAWMFVTVIFFSVSRSLSPGVETQFFHFDEQLKRIVHSEAFKNSAVSKLTGTDDPGAPETLSDLEHQVAKVRGAPAMASVLYAAILTEEHKPVPAWDIRKMKDGKEPGTRAMGEVYGSKTLSLPRAKYLTSQFKESGFFVTELAKVAAFEKAGDKKARSRIIESPSLSEVLIGFLGFGVLIFGGIVCGMGYFACRVNKELTPLGALNSKISLSRADLFAVRAAQLMAIFLLSEIVVAYSMKRALEPVQTIVQGIVMLVAVWFLQKLPVQDEIFKLSRLGIERANWGLNVLWGIGGFFVELPIAMLLAVIASAIFKFLPAPEHPAAIELTLKHDPLTIISLLFAGTIVAPIWEELMFRGLLFPALSRVLRNVPMGAVVSSLLFASIHPQGVAIWASLATTALMSCALVYQTKSLVPSIVMHFCHNMTLMLLTILVS